MLFSAPPTIDALVARERYGAVLGCEPACSTDDGTYGRAGFCTPLVEEALAAAAAEGAPYDYVACCGPEPLMKIVAGMADAAGVFCEVSMERRMACGVGACLSCVVDTTDWQAPRLRGRPGVLCERGGVVMQRKPKETSVNLSVNLGGMAMKNPVTVASGTFGAGMRVPRLRGRGGPGRRHHQGRVFERLGGQRKPPHCRDGFGHVELHRPSEPRCRST